MATMLTSDVISFTITPTKADGTPGQVDAASVVVASSDETVITIINLMPSNTVIEGTVNAVAEGTARFTVVADADLGAGVSTITGVSEDITVTQDPADLSSTFTITLGAPVPKAPTATPVR